MFVDEAKIYVFGGNGGNGCMSFRREKFVPHGGPNGGDGGDGGNVVLVVDPHLNTLLNFKYVQHFKAQKGSHGQGANKHGRTGEDFVVTVPLGTIVRDEATGAILADMSEPGDRLTAARGGRGGRGNARFATATNQAPRRADKGIPGEERTLLMELKILADVGLVGFPNAGKSTFLSVVSDAHPKIADYPFTTLVPILGIVSWGESKTFVMADIPGLIEGAHEGKGLGFRFLRHIERTKVLLFMIECTSEDPVAQYRKLIEELKLYSPVLVDKPRIVALTKTDLVPPGELKIPDFGEPFEVYPISSATGDGVQKLLYRLGSLVASLRP